MNRHLTFLTLSLAIASTATISAADNQVSVTTQSAAPRAIEVTAINDNIIRVANTPKGEQTPVSQTLLSPKHDADTKLFSTADSDILTTASGIVVTVDKVDGAVTIAAPNGVVVADNGVRQSINGKEKMTITTPGNESFYGAGERGYKLNLANDTLVMFNRQNYGYTAGEERIKQMNITMPLIISSKGYAILFDDFAASTLTTSNPLTYTTEANNSPAYYFINGITGDTRQARIDNLIAQITKLTGRQELPPLWSLGYITSKYGYRTEGETRGVIDSLHRAGYPVDGVVLDLYWYGKEEDMGRLGWDKEQWPLL